MTGLHAIDDAHGETGWQSLGIPVDGLDGQTVVLVIHAQSSLVSELSIFGRCQPGVVLLDNLRFE